MKSKTEIKVKGRLGQNWKNCFEGLNIIIDGDNTILSGKIKDSSYLHGILNRIRDLNLKLISVNTSEEN